MNPYTTPEFIARVRARADQEIARLRDERLLAESDARMADLMTNGPRIDADGLIAEGLFTGMTPDEVMADRETFRRAMGE